MSNFERHYLKRILTAYNNVNTKYSKGTQSNYKIGWLHTFNELKSKQAEIYNISNNLITYIKYLRT